VAIFRLISNSLAPLTLLGAVAAYVYPPAFLVFDKTFLWYFAATMLALGIVLDPSEFVEILKRPRPLFPAFFTPYGAS
jgi:BASS family bile acid:Na+ symporter